MYKKRGGISPAPFLTGFPCRRSALQSLRDVQDDIHAAVDAELRAVQAEVIDRRAAPLLVRVVVIIRGALLIHLLDEVFGLLNALDLIDVLDLVDAEIHVRVHEHVQDVLMVLQRLVSAAAHDHAGLLLGQVFDRVELGEEDLLLERDIDETRLRITRGKDVGYHAAEDAAHGLLVMFLEDVLGNVILRGRQLDDLLIIALDTEFLRDRPSDVTAAASELSADGNYEIISHFWYSLP